MSDSIMFNWIMFRKMFALMHDDGIDLQRISTNPSTVLTSYVTAYLTLGAGEDISDYFHSKWRDFEETKWAKK